MGYPAFQYSSLKKILAEVKIALELTNSTTEDIKLTMWIIEAAAEMMTMGELVELTATIPICDFRAQLPCEFFMFDRPNPLVFTTNGVADNSLWCSNWTVTYTGAAFIKCSPYQGFLSTRGVPVINVQDGYIYFSNNVDATECTISYLGVNVTENGDAKIPAINVRPIKEYVFGQYYLFQEKPSLSAIHMATWTRGKLHRRAKAKIPDSIEKEQLSRIMHALL